jgi:hypothetical protein
MAFGENDPVGPIALELAHRSPFRAGVFHQIRAQTGDFGQHEELGEALVRTRPRLADSGEICGHQGQQRLEPA